MPKTAWPTQDTSKLVGKILSRKRDIPFSTIKDDLPVPIYPDRPEFIELYWLAWELAWDHVMENEGAPQSPYMDEAHSRDRIWYWDTCFMVCFCKYAPQHFPGIQSLKNFYLPVLDGVPSSLAIHHPDNPPMFAWVEHEHAKLTGDLEHLKWLVLEKRYLQRFHEFYEWIDAANPPLRLPGSAPFFARRMPTREMIEKEGYPDELWGYQWSGIASGMDNTPRGRDDKEALLWVDLLGQLALSARSIVEIAKIIIENAGDGGDGPPGGTEPAVVEKARNIIEEYQVKYEELKQLLNAHYWDTEDGFYYDLLMDLDEEGDPRNRSIPDTFCKVKTPASYWPVLAGCCDGDGVRAGAMAGWADDHDRGFGAPRPWPSVTRDDPDFVPDGHYWRGGIWLPTAYVGQKALARLGYLDITRKNAIALLELMHATYKNVESEENPDGDLEIATIWEAYSPTENLPAAYKNRLQLSRPHFCGWSALGPISMLIEDVLGFHEIDAFNRVVRWNLGLAGEHGIKKLRFGTNLVDIVHDGKGSIHVEAREPFTLVVNDTKFDIPAGSTRLDVPG